MDTIGTAEHGLVKVRTTLPRLSPSSTIQPVVTERLTLRPLTQDDLQDYHELRSQKEVMIFTAVGRPDRNLEETQTKLSLFLPPNDTKTFNKAICLSTTGELVGAGGVHKFASSEFGWPEVGYMLKREHWGKGYATEFLRAFVKAWWELPRSEAELDVAAMSVAKGEDAALEQLYAGIDADNVGSMRVLEKLGFRKLREWEEPDSRVGFEGQNVRLHAYVLQRPAP